MTFRSTGRSSSTRVNDVVRRMLTANGLPWTRPNRPHSLCVVPVEITIFNSSLSSAMAVLVVLTTPAAVSSAWSETKPLPDRPSEAAGTPGYGVRCDRSTWIARL